jgi:hypothetical protein
MFKAFLSKMPAWLWLLLSVIIISAAVAYMDKAALCIYLNCSIVTFSDKAQILSAFIAALSLIYLGFQVGEQRKAARFATDYTNRPVFRFTQFNSGKPIEEHGKAELCTNMTHTNSNNCIDDHWFNIENIGQIAAKNLTIGLFHSEEISDITLQKKRWVNLENLYPGIKNQFKLPSTEIHTRFFQPGKNDSFYVLVEYKSAYSNIKNRQIYQLEYSTINGITSIPSWNSKAYSFYFFRLLDDKSYLEVSLYKIFKAKIIAQFGFKVSSIQWLDYFITVKNSK